MKGNDWITRAALLLSVALTLGACETGVEVSPQPGVLRVTLQSHPADTSIVIVREPVRVRDGDQLNATVFQGKAYTAEGRFFILFPNLQSNRQRDETYNILARQGGEYVKHTVFETFLPPDVYERLEFGITASQLRISTFQIPIRLPDGERLLIDLEVPFEIFENQVTEFNVQIYPLQSVTRFRNAFLFNRKIEVAGIQQGSM